MNFDGLTTAYWNSQIERVERLRAKIQARPALSEGRVVPDDDDLLIGAGRRLEAAVMFTDISGFSQRQSITSAQQDAMLRVLNLYLTEMIRIIEDYGGSVEKNTGDGLMAYFERGKIGSADENATKRAVACALTMDAATKYLINPIIEAAGISPIAYRTTLDFGPITIARIGAPGRFNANVAIGNAANFAAKMLGHVQPGEIGLGWRAWNQLPEFWRTLWTYQSATSTGWVFSGLDTPYPLYIYNGRWNKLI